MYEVTKEGIRKGKVIERVKAGTLVAFLIREKGRAKGGLKVRELMWPQGLGDTMILRDCVAQKVKS